MRLSTGFLWRRKLVSVTAASALSCAFWLQRISLLRWVAFTMAQPSLRLRYPSTPARRVSGVRLPDTAVSPRFSPLRTSRWAGGDAFTPASGGQDLHLHKDRVTRPFRLAACPEICTSFQPTDRTIHNAAFYFCKRWSFVAWSSVAYLVNTGVSALAWARCSVS